MSTNQRDEEALLVPPANAPIDGDDISGDVSIASPFDIGQIRIDSKPAQLDSLIKRLRNNEIDLTPNFQRNPGIWSEKAQSRLIESFILRIPVPSFYFDASDNNKWLVVDGLQRLTAIRRLVVQEEAPLTKLEFLTKYDGAKVSQLPRNLVRNIEESDINMYLIQSGTPPEMKFNLFKRINTGGQPLTSQEIRHALNQGKVIDFLGRMAAHSNFLIATANGINKNRMDDRECVTRFLAFRLTEPEQYESGDFDHFLNSGLFEIMQPMQEHL